VDQRTIWSHGYVMMHTFTNTKSASLPVFPVTLSFSLSLTCSLSLHWFARLNSDKDWPVQYLVIFQMNIDEQGPRARRPSCVTKAHKAITSPQSIQADTCPCSKLVVAKTPVMRNLQSKIWIVKYSSLAWKALRE
jgi:hypothetical protein